MLGIGNGSGKENGCGAEGDLGIGDGGREMNSTLESMESELLPFGW